MQPYTVTNQSQEEQARSPRRRNAGVPGFAVGQREAILKMLRAAGAVGVSKELLLYEKHWSQAAARIFELEQQGFEIKHVQRDGEKYVTYILETEPAHPKPLPTYAKKSSTDWYERQTGGHRPASSAGPLFDAVTEI
jgi:predicted RecB family nuclease